MDGHGSADANERTFSVSEANELLPMLEQQLSLAREARRALRSIQHEIRRASLAAKSGGGSPVGALYVRAIEQMAASLNALQETGVVIKDLDAGLCDFPHRHEGRVVYLCWKLGEREIGWWHEITSGYQGRQPIEELTE